MISESTNLLSNPVSDKELNLLWKICYLRFEKAIAKVGDEEKKLELMIRLEKIKAEFLGD